MNRALEVFDTRETGIFTYAVPSDDRLDESGTTNLFPPQPPVLLDVDFGSLTFSTVENADSYKIERRMEGGGWEVIGTVPHEDGEIVFSSDEIIAVAFYRVIATNEVGDSLPSNVMKLDFDPESSSPSGGGEESGGEEGDVCLTGVTLAQALQKYAIVDYFDGMFANPAGPDLKPTWDGVFIKYYVDVDAIRWVSEDSFVYLMSGNVLCRADLKLNDCDGSTPLWRLEIIAADGQMCWAGDKVGGQSPSGTYTYDLGFETGVPTVVIAPALGTTTEATEVACAS